MLHVGRAHVVEAAFRAARSATRVRHILEGIDRLRKAARTMLIISPRPIASAAPEKDVDAVRALLERRELSGIVADPVVFPGTKTIAVLHTRLHSCASCPAPERMGSCDRPRRSACAAMSVLHGPVERDVRGLGRLAAGDDHAVLLGDLLAELAKSASAFFIRASEGLRRSTLQITRPGTTLTMPGIGRMAPIAARISRP